MKKPTHWSTHATCVGISACGNYALVGTRGGTIYKYNIQSGIARSSYPKMLDSSLGSAQQNRPSNLPGSVKTTLKKIQPDKMLSPNEIKAKEKEIGMVEFDKETLQVSE